MAKRPHSEDEIIPLNEETQIALLGDLQENELALTTPRNSLDEIIPLNEGTQIALLGDPGENELALAIPGTSETQIALPSDVNQRAPEQSEVVVAGGNYHGTVIGPQTNKKVFKATDNRNARITNIYHQYGGGNGNDESSTSSSEAKRRKMESSSIDKGYTQLSEGIFMYNKQPLREGTRIYEGYQQHAAGVRRPLAIKMVVPCTDTHIKEVQHLVKLGSHPNLVQIIHSKERHGTTRELYIAMELCSFQNLQDYLDENCEANVPFDFDKTISFSKQLISGLKHIHDSDIVHGDMKPQNVLLSLDHKHIKLTDFGISKGICPGRPGVTFTDFGTTGYRAPELFSSNIISKSADIFSLGISMFCLFSNGKHPFGDDPDLLNYNIKKNKGRDFSSLLLTGSKKEELLDLITQMLQSDPKKRPAIEEVFQHSFFTTPSRKASVDRSDNNDSETSPKQAFTDDLTSEEDLFDFDEEYYLDEHETSSENSSVRSRSTWLEDEDREDIYFDEDDLLDHVDEENTPSPNSSTQLDFSKYDCGDDDDVSEFSSDDDLYY